MRLSIFLCICNLDSSIEQKMVVVKMAYQPDNVLLAYLNHLRLGMLIVFDNGN